MANLKEQSVWEEGIYQIETSDPVMGGEHGIDNKAPRQLANRTKWLRDQLTTQQTALSSKANTRHTHGIADISGLQNALNSKLAASQLSSASTSQAGVVQLSSAVNSESEATAATSKAVKQAFDRAVEAEGKGLPVGAIVAFPWAVNNPEGYLLCNGSAFSRETYPDLYRVLGNRDRVPHLSRSDIGQTAYFPVDAIPSGWIAFDDIERLVTRSAYRELYDLLVAKYGSIAAVPKAADRYIRGNANGLNVGTTQEDAIRNITGFFGNQSSAYHQIFENVDVGGAFTKTTGWKRWSVDTNDGSNCVNGINFDASLVVPTADENRPKTIVFKLCIKALNTFTDVGFWIKAFGRVSNEGSLNAAGLARDLNTLRQDLNNKANTTSISDLNNRKADKSDFSRQTIGEFEIIKYPDGTMIQTYRYTPNGGRLVNRDHWRLTFNWAVSFLNQPRIFTQFVNNEQTATGNYTNASIDTFVEIVAQETNNAKVVFNTYEQNHNGTRSFIDFLAIGRWK